MDAVDERTRVISVSMVQYATGTVVDVTRLARIAAQAGAFLIVDATQAAGAMAVDTSTLGADAVVTSGYKWLGGHGGVALAVVSERLGRQLPVLPGWMSAPAPFEFDARAVSFAPDARRFTLSTLPYISVAGVTTATVVYGRARNRGARPKVSDDVDRGCSRVWMEAVSGYWFRICISTYRVPGARP
jgi:selenocysteine lyase/cysteine desulfurase